MEKLVNHHLVLLNIEHTEKDVQSSVIPNSKQICIIVTVVLERMLFQGRNERLKLICIIATVVIE